MMYEDSRIDQSLRNLLEPDLSIEDRISRVWVPAATAVDAYLREQVANLISQPSSPTEAARNALACAALVERGLSPDLAITAILDRLEHQIYPDAVRFVRACEAAEEANPTPPSVDLACCQSIDYWNPVTIHGRHLEVEQPQLGASYQAVAHFELAAKTMLSRSAQARKEARLRFRSRLPGDLLKQSRTYHDSEFRKLIRALDDEPILIVHPARLKGFLVRVFEVVEIGHLERLINATLVERGWFPWTRRKQAILGEVSIPNRHLATEQFLVRSAPRRHTLWTWQAWQSAGRLPEVCPIGQEHQIEGPQTPDMIPHFKEMRVILIGKSPLSGYPSVLHHSPNLNPRLVVDQVLSRDGVRSWLDRFAQGE